jgi:hypothetical protein
MKRNFECEKRQEHSHKFVSIFDFHMQRVTFGLQTQITEPLAIDDLMGLL